MAVGYSDAGDGGRERAIMSIAGVIETEQKDAEFQAKLDAPHTMLARSISARLLNAGLLHDYAQDDGVGNVEVIIDEEIVRWVYSMDSKDFLAKHWEEHHDKGTPTD